MCNTHIAEGRHLFRDYVLQIDFLIDHKSALVNNKT